MSVSLDRCRNASTLSSLRHYHSFSTQSPTPSHPPTAKRVSLPSTQHQLNYLLHLPTTPPEKRAEVAGRLGDVIVDLAVSLGLQRSTILQQVGRQVPLVR